MRIHLTENTFIKHIYIVLALWDLDAMCHKKQENLFIYTMKCILSDQCSREQFLKQNMIIWQEAVVVLKELIFNNVYFGRVWWSWKNWFLRVSLLGECGGLERTDFNSFCFGRVWLLMYYEKVLKCGLKHNYLLDNLTGFHLLALRCHMCVLAVKYSACCRPKVPIDWGSCHWNDHTTSPLFS